LQAWLEAVVVSRWANLDMHAHAYMHAHADWGYLHAGSRQPPRTQ